MPDSFKSFETSKYYSTKHKNYFKIYDHIFKKYIGKKIILVEIGILNGGSLFMWRNFFDGNAEIIGVDLNPNAKKWEKHGFKIFIGDQSDPNFWRDFFKKVGNVDIVIDDGGHTNKQQVFTLLETIPNINDNGMLVVEDVHSSYMTKFRNPSKYSFISFSKTIVDELNSRQKKMNFLQEKIFCVEFYRSIAVFNIDSNYTLSQEKISNKGICDNAEDLRFKNDKMFLDKFLSKLEFLFNKYLIKENKNSSYKSFLKIMTKILSVFQDKELKKKFKLYD
ncbi:MAG: hypothetical protein CMI70_03925 [Candidatus Pelagibacter sp.]|jgi:hypothetical protein|nr:hypothetical protein [Candidatus Pelagibacter sp.]|tara:strand:+ start:1158 stop:1991 length:834 start_codon:yes stop_codon:yes gene_type:complete